MNMLTCGMENKNDQGRGRKIFVGGLSAELTEDEFKNYFEKFGKVTDVVVMHDTVTNRPRGFGFITFDSVESIEAVLRNSFHELNGRRVEVKRAIPKNGINNDGHIPNSRTHRGKSPLPNRNVPYPYPYYGFGCTFYPGFTPFPLYGGPGVDLYGLNFYGNWFPPSFGNMASADADAWYGPNLFGGRMFPPPYRNSLIPPSRTRRNGEIKPSPTGKRIMSADAVPFQIKDRTRRDS